MDGSRSRNGAPVLIVIGGPQGSGKTAVATRLSLDLRIPRLDPDILRRAIQSSESFPMSHSDAVKMAYSILWKLAGEFLRAGV
jgi:predicted kinase